MSTFGAVNGILLTSSRLFYAGACEGQMPEILTMIQIQRLTPTPAVLAISFVSRTRAISISVHALTLTLFTLAVVNGLSLCLRYLRID